MVERREDQPRVDPGLTMRPEGAETQPSPPFHLAPTWLPEVELSSLPCPATLCPPILFHRAPLLTLLMDLALVWT